MRDFCVAILALFGFALVAYGLKCRRCVREDPHIGCLGKMSECKPKKGSVCIALSIYYKRAMLYRIEGCAANPKLCRRNVVSKRMGHYVNLTCCASHDFCNHWEHEEED